MFQLIPEVSVTGDYQSMLFFQWDEANLQTWKISEFPLRCSLKCRIYYIASDGWVCCSHRMALCEFWKFLVGKDEDGMRVSAAKLGVEGRCKPLSLGGMNSRKLLVP